MAIISDENNNKTFCIKETSEREGISLPTAKEYFLMLNKESYALSDINTWGGYTDPNRYDVFFINNNPNEFGVIIGHEFSPFIYRGQTHNKPFVPTANRFRFWKKEDKINKCIAWVKKQEFIQLFKDTPYYARCQNFEVLNCKFRFDMEAIAQHYGFISNYLDITRDLFVALFFAYTYVDENGQYKPIDNFRKYKPILFVGNLKKIFSKYPNCLKIIGFQALLRPCVQKAMAIEILKKEKIKPLFEKIKLPKSYAIACEIFKRANGGLNIFPKNDIIYHCAKQIKERKSLDIEYINQFCELYKYDIEKIKIELQNKGYEFTAEKWGIPDVIIKAINKEIDTGIIPYINDRIAYRGVSEPLYPAKGKVKV